MYSYTDRNPGVRKAIDIVNGECPVAFAIGAYILCQRGNREIYALSSESQSSMIGLLRTT